MKRAPLFAIAICLTVLPKTTRADPYQETATPGSLQDTSDEPLLPAFSLDAAAGYLDRRAHLNEENCYACHSTFTYLPARSLIDPLAGEVLRTRVLLERLMTAVLDPAQEPSVKVQHKERIRILAAVELARHDAISTGTLSPLARRALDAVWRSQKDDGGIGWIKVGEAPQATDDWWPVAMMAEGAGAAPDGYATSEPARTHIEKLRLWFRSHPPQTLHERSLTLIAHAAIGGIVPDEVKGPFIEAVYEQQHPDGGWSVPDLAPWKRKDGKPLDPSRTDGYATALCAYAIARNGVTPAVEPRLAKAVAWLRTNQRESGGWFTQSPFRREKLASNTGTSFAIQALAACGEIPMPKTVTAEHFATAMKIADSELPPGVYVPNAVAKNGK